MEEMKAGRELDALVAERVMGLFVLDKAPQELMFWVTHLPKSERKGNFICSPMKHYSTDIEDAWEVVEKVIEKNEFLIEYGWIKNPGDHWHCHIGVHDVVAETAPLAICIAALKVVGSA